jgi:hypothetical protein
MTPIRLVVLFVVFSVIQSCDNASSREVLVDSSAKAGEDTAVVSTPIAPSTQSQVNSGSHDWAFGRYSYVDPNAGVIGMITLGRDKVFTQVGLVSGNGFKTSGHGTFEITEGENDLALLLKRESGVAFNGVASLKSDSGTITITLPTGARYIKDENGYYIKNQISTLISNVENGGESNNAERSSEDGVSENNDKPDQRKWSGDRNQSQQSGDLVYEGNMNDEQSGISQHYILKIKSDLRSASIGDGPYNRLEDQGDGSYMWIDGTIIGMSIKPSRNSCVVYGNDGSYFCTLFRR